MLKPSIDLFHTIIIVPDLKRSVNFYREKLGFKVLMETYDLELHPGTGKLLHVGVIERNDDVHGMLELVQIPGADKSAGSTKQDSEISYNKGYWAVVFEVKDLKVTYRDWKAKGVNFVNEPNFQIVPGEIKTWSVLLKDIDGNLIELVQPVEFSGRTG